MDSVVYSFLKSAFAVDINDDKQKLYYWPVGMTLASSTDSIGYLDERLTDVAKGYTYFLEEQSRL